MLTTCLPRYNQVLVIQAQTFGAAVTETFSVFFSHPKRTSSENKTQEDKMPKCSTQSLEYPCRASHEVVQVM